MIVLTHANLNRPIYFQDKSCIICWHWNEPTKSVVVYAGTGVIIPVKESVEDLCKLLGGQIPRKDGHV